MKISVIIPTYKPQEYLWECLDSLESQSFPKEDFEVIIILNGEKEPYCTQIEKYISGHKTDIRLLYSEEKGVSAARNIGLDASHGEYIAFIDDDDFVSEVYLEELYSKAASDTIVIAYPHGFDENNSELDSYKTAEDFKRLAKSGKTGYIYSRNLLHVAAMKLIPSEIIGSRRFDTSMQNGEDTLFMFLISDRFIFVDFTSPDAIYYRRFRTRGAVKSFIRSSLWEKTRKSFKSIRKYTSIYLSAADRYSFRFYATRVWGALHNIIRK